MNNFCFSLCKRNTAHIYGNDKSAICKTSLMTPQVPRWGRTPSAQAKSNWSGLPNAPMLPSGRWRPTATYHTSSFEHWHWTRILSLSSQQFEANKSKINFLEGRWLVCQYDLTYILASWSGWLNCADMYLGKEYLRQRHAGLHLGKKEAKMLNVLTEWSS